MYRPCISQEDFTLPQLHCTYRGVFCNMSPPCSLVFYLYMIPLWLNGSPFPSLTSFLFIHSYPLSTYDWPHPKFPG